jgi:hypothetical protein
VVLDGHRLLGGVHHACAGAVVEVDVCDLHAAGQRVGVDCEVVVLCRDLDAARGVVPDGVVAAVVAELQLEGLACRGKEGRWLGNKCGAGENDKSVCVAQVRGLTVGATHALWGGMAGSGAVCEYASVWDEHASVMPTIVQQPRHRHHCL